MEDKNNPLTQSSPEQRRRFLKVFGAAAALLPITAITGCSDDPPPAPTSSQPSSDPQPAAQQSQPSEPAAAEPEPEPMESAASEASAEMERVSLDDPTAQALGYKHDAGKLVNAKGWCSGYTPKVG